MEKWPSDDSQGSTCDVHELADGSIEISKVNQPIRRLPLKPQVSRVMLAKFERWYDIQNCEGGNAGESHRLPFRPSAGRAVRRGSTNVLWSVCQSR